MRVFLSKKHRKFVYLINVQTIIFHIRILKQAYCYQWCSEVTFEIFENGTKIYEHLWSLLMPLTWSTCKNLITKNSMRLSAATNGMPHVAMADRRPHVKKTWIHINYRLKDQLIVGGIFNLMYVLDRKIFQIPNTHVLMTEKLPFCIRLSIWAEKLALQPISFQSLLHCRWESCHFLWILSRTLSESKYCEWSKTLDEINGASFFLFPPVSLECAKRRVFVRYVFIYFLFVSLFFIFKGNYR